MCLLSLNLKQFLQIRGYKLKNRIFQIITELYNEHLILHFTNKALYCYVLHKYRKSCWMFKGDLHFCPSRLQLYATSHHTTIGQYNRSCYEMLHTKLPWNDADDQCRRAGGHLVTINDVKEQTYIEAFMLRHNPREDVWIGLFDKGSEGRYHWLSGNWKQFMLI